MTPPPPCWLRCAYLVNPLGVAPGRVRFSWRPGTGDEPGLAQHAYQVRVRADGWGGDREVWDSGRVESGCCADVGYGGAALAAGARYEWAVRVWAGRDDPSPWSEPAWFEVELDAGGWQAAAWIGIGRTRQITEPPSGPADQVARSLTPAPYLRREFTVGGQVAAARLHVTARGLYEARLNGSRVGDAVLTPGWTDYAQRVQYQTYDVTSLVREGGNVLGAMLADGWYCGFIGFDAKRAGAMYGDAPELLAQLVITLADGSQQRIGTDDRWRAAIGAVRHADLLMGELQDLSAEPAGWDRPGFSADGWLPVQCRDRDDVSLVADPGPPVRVTAELPPRRITTDHSGRCIVDFGQNLTGWVRIGYDGQAGERITVRHAEVLNPDGTLYTANLRTARQTDEYLTVSGPQVLEPRFTVHGFRYAEISGQAGPLDQAALTGLTARVAHSDIPVSGTFESSQAWLNQLFANIDWAQRGNFVSVPTDCPQRDERIGWLGDAQIFAATACLNRDVAAFFGKWLDDVADAQLPSGAFSDIAPTMNLAWAGAPAWADAGVIVPWTLYRMYGDLGSAARHYRSMTAWMDFVERGNPGYLRVSELGNGYNDWLSPGPDLTPRPLLATAYWAYDAAIMSELAQALGRPGDAAAYQALRAKIGAAFAGAFVAADGTITSGTQTAYALGLHMGLVPDDLRAAAAGHLAAAIEAAGCRLTTGFVGVGYLLPVLCASGYADVAYRLLGQDAMPSWRYMIDHGATTIWERWDGWTAERGFQSPSMNSFNHYALGSVGEWLYRFVLGIDQAPGSAGFERLDMRPHTDQSLAWARGSYDSVKGLIAAGWTRGGGTLTFRVELPPGVTATVRVPSSDAARVRDAAGGEPSRIEDYPGAFGVREAVFEAGPGVHEFTGPDHVTP